MKISFLYEDEAHRRKVASAEFVVRDTSLSPPKPLNPEVPKVHLAGFLNGIKWPREVEWKYSTSPDPLNGQYLSITHRHAGGPTRYHFNWDAINQRRIGYGNINEYLDDLWGRIKNNAASLNSPLWLDEFPEPGFWRGNPPQSIHGMNRTLRVHENFDSKSDKRYLSFNLMEFQETIISD